MSRIRRSVMFTPGTRGDRLLKASQGPADTVVADLEDAVPPVEKEKARRTVRDWLQTTRATTGTGGPERAVRIGAWGTPDARRDLLATLPGAPDAVVLPKAERWTDLVALDLVVSRLERANGITPGSIGLIAILETGVGVLAAGRIARATPRLVALAFGAEDLMADIGGVRSRANTEVLHARSHVAIAARAARLQALDQVFVDLKDGDGLRREASEARALGYTGKMVLHPDQIAPVHAAFSPSETEVAEARRLLAAVESAGIGSGGVVAFEGRMVDRPLIEQARQTVRLAEAGR